MRKNILVLAYVVSPYRGSEYSVAWNFVTQMAKECDLTILYGASGAHMGDVKELEEYLSKHRVPNVEFIPVLPGSFANLLNMANRRGLLTYSFYFAYRLWHKRVYEVAREITKNKSFDLIHYLGPIGYREPGYLWKIDLPYVWGPIGGANNVPMALLPSLPFLGKAKLLFRASVNWIQLRFNRRLKSALNRTDVLLTATTENQEIFRRLHGKNSLYIPENGVVESYPINSSKFEGINSTIQLIWIGAIEPRKALPILIESLANCNNPSRFIVHVVGSGPLQSAMINRVEKAGLKSSFIWHGQVSRDEVKSLLSISHLHVVTSVSEGNPTTIWEAMSCGVPTMTIDHCGMHDTVKESAGIKVPLTDYSEVIKKFTQSLNDIDKKPDTLIRMAKEVSEGIDEFSWKHRVRFFLEQYDVAIASRRSLA